MTARHSYPIQLRRPRDLQEARRRRSSLRTTATDTPLPYRWDITRAEQLGPLSNRGSLVGTNYQVGRDGFIDSLLDCTARTVAACGDSDLVFVGRSLESQFDLLSGLLKFTSWQDSRLVLLRYSTGYTSSEVAILQNPLSPPHQAFRSYLVSIGLSPAQILVRERPVTLIDVIASGDTMQKLLQLIHLWTVEENIDWPGVRRKLRIVGLIRNDDDKPPVPRRLRRKAGYRSFSWKDSADWLDTLLDRNALHEVTVSAPFWHFLADHQAKTTPSFKPVYWGTEGASHPCHNNYYLASLREARRLYKLGISRDVRCRFASRLAQQSLAMRESWCRTLIGEIRKHHASSGRGKRTAL